MKHVKVGQWSIDYNPKPIPDRRFDYDVCHDEYDGESGDFFFNAESVEEAKKEIQLREDVLEEQGFYYEEHSKNQYVG